LLVSTITQKLKPVFTKFDIKGAQKKPSAFGDNPDHVTLRLGLEWGTGHGCG